MEKKFVLIVISETVKFKDILCGEIRMNSQQTTAETFLIIIIICLVIALFISQIGLITLIALSGITLIYVELKKRAKTSE